MGTSSIRVTRMVNANRLTREASLEGPGCSRESSLKNKTYVRVS